MTHLSRVSPEQTVPPIAYEMWPEMVPNHGITIIAGIRPEGAEAIHVVASSNTPPWTIVGMLQCVLADIEELWRAGPGDGE